MVTRISRAWEEQSIGAILKGFQAQHWQLASGQSLRWQSFGKVTSTTARKISSLLRVVGIVINTLPQCKLFFGLDWGLLHWGSYVVRQRLPCWNTSWASKGTMRILAFTTQSGFIFWVRYVFQKSRDRILPEPGTHLCMSSTVWCHEQYYPAQASTDAQTEFLVTSSVWLSPRNYCTQGNKATGFIWCANCLSVPTTDACKISVCKEKEDFGIIVMETAVMTCWPHHLFRVLARQTQGQDVMTESHHASHVRKPKRGKGRLSPWLGNKVTPLKVPSVPNIAA